jgi:ABC-type sugar transport system ATPase subunit
MNSMNVIETTSLGKRYGRSWALRECTFAIPEGHLAALVGPNGAGKTTLLHLLVGLTNTTAGTATVLAGQPVGSRAALDGIAFVAQDTPVYTSLTGANMIRVARNLNWSFDPAYAVAADGAGHLAAAPGHADRGGRAVRGGGPLPGHHGPDHSSRLGRLGRRGGRLPSGELADLSGTRQQLQRPLA